MSLLIETKTDVQRGAEALADICPRMSMVYKLTGVPPLRRRPDGFTQLFSAIVSQQVSVASAAAIWVRIEGAGLTTPAAILAADDEILRKPGLSQQKIRYARVLAGAGIDYTALHHMPDEEVISQLTAVPGIGRWTAEIYLMFSLGRPDVFAAGDLALQEATRHLFELEVRPNERNMRHIAAQWTPWRAVAARLLWAYYKHIRQKEGIR